MSTTTAWLMLILSGLVDVAWALSMKKANGFENLTWSAVSLVLLAAFVVMLTKALAVLPVGTAYAVWTGIGAAGTVIAGAVWLGEAVSLDKICGVLLVLAGAWILVVRPPRERPMAWLRSPPYPPEAERCAFTAEESISTLAGGPPALASRGRGRPRRPLRPSGHSGCRASCAVRSRAAHRSSARRTSEHGRCR